MKNTFGNQVTLTLFGESRGSAIGAVLDGLAPGVDVDEKAIAAYLTRRRPAGAYSTPRREPDAFVIESGVYRGKTTGAPLCIRIPNADAEEGKEIGETVARPGHADYTAYEKYHGYEDTRGGGHFSGRLTAAIVAAGAILTEALKKRHILLGTHLAECAALHDIPFSSDAEKAKAQLVKLQENAFPVLDTAVGEKMKLKMCAAAEEGDSLGGLLETVVLGYPAGVGEPWFDSMEGVLAHALFSIPGIKGVSFGEGFALASKRGSECLQRLTVENRAVKVENDPYGGIDGGITNGGRIAFSCAVKPTPSIHTPIQTVDFAKPEEVMLTLSGRHDPCIAHRAAHVVNAVTALVLCDMLAERFGRDWLADAKESGRK